MSSPSTTLVCPDARTDTRDRVFESDSRSRDHDESETPGESLAAGRGEAIDRWSWWSRSCRRLVHRQLSSLRGGRLQVVDAEGTSQFGEGGGLQATMRVLDPRCYRRLVRSGEVGFAEALMAGECECDDLFTLVRIFVRNEALSQRLDRGLARLGGLWAKGLQALRRNTRRGARRNIHQHYDLGNDFYRLFLDRTWSYSSGVFPHPEATLEEASLAKLELVGRKLDLQPTDHVLEIGTGWGGLAIFAAQRYGCRVTTTTISQEQFTLARERIREAGVSDRVTVLLQDYRDLTGQYNKLVSIEMIEAVGHQYWSTYFRQCSRLLKPEGLMLIQAIVMSDQRFASYLRGTDFIRRYIFPGGCLPSIQVLADTVARHTDLRMLQLEDIGPHYVGTLLRWREEFWRNIEEVRRLGFSESFVRMWDYYFNYCAAAFAERQVNNVQVVWGKPACRAIFPQ